MRFFFFFFELGIKEEQGKQGRHCTWDQNSFSGVGTGQGIRSSRLGTGLNTQQAERLVLGHKPNRGRERLKFNKN